MNYELAKELKEAGFPLREVQIGMSCRPDEYYDFNPEGKQVIGSQHFFKPTLSELIEACGERFECLRKNVGNDSQWMASGFTDKEGFMAGSTKSPEEAVARLWLALNKNGNNQEN